MMDKVKRGYWKRIRATLMEIVLPVDQVLTVWTFLKKCTSGRPDHGKKAKIKRVQVGSLEEVASSCHLLPLLLTKLKGLMC